MRLCGRLSSQTRVVSPRSLPTDHDYAVPTREYQSDQPSRQSPRPPSMLPPSMKDVANLTRSFHIRSIARAIPPRVMQKSESRVSEMERNATSKTRFLRFP